MTNSITKAIDNLISNNVAMPIFTVLFSSLIIAFYYPENGVFTEDTGLSVLILKSSAALLTLAVINLFCQIFQKK